MLFSDISHAFSRMGKICLAGKKRKRVGWMFVCNSAVGQCIILGNTLFPILEDDYEFEMLFVMARKCDAVRQ
jgi:hypothetical protein